MIDQRLRSRLEQLNRGPLPADTLPARSAQSSPATGGGSPLRPRAVKPITGLLKRGTVASNEAGDHWLVRIPLEELWPGGQELAFKRHIFLSGEPALGPTSRGKQELTEFIRAFPANLMLVDLETCGLAGSSLFLVGMLRFVEDQLAVELLLARNYAEERAVLVTFWQAVAPDTVVVTFNGKSFDWPMLADRSARHLLFRQTRAPNPTHVDLLHHARRRWRRQLPDCKLQTLERHICGRGRTTDIPGSLIPAAYQQYVRSGSTAEMDVVLLHNAIDLVTLLDLGLRLAG